MTSPSKPRGAALLIVLVSIAVVTAISVDLAYQTRVSLQMAANARDELRATGLAKSAMNVSRLVLHFQQQLDGATSAASQALGAGTLASAGAATGAAANAAPAGVGGLLASLGGLGGAAGGGLGGLRLWELVPVNSNVVPLLLGGGGPGPRGADPAAPAAPAAGASGAPAAGPPMRAFGDFEGAFSARIEDEERKVNVRQLNAIGPLAAAQALRLAELVRDPRYDFLFDQDDANGWRVPRKDLFAALKDWVDEDETSSVFTANPLQPFEQGTADENTLYGRLKDRYQAKNAPFDSEDELYLVAGGTDAFMAAFGDRLTVYPDVNSPINVNAATRTELVLNATVMSDLVRGIQPVLLDPAFGEKLEAALALARPLPFLSMTPQQFAGVLTVLGVRVLPEYLQPNNPRAAFTDHSSTFRIRATGQAGDVTKELQAVVTFDRRAGALAQDLGRLLHWHEE